jgi:hypothetical protein
LIENVARAAVGNLISFPFATGAQLLRKGQLRIREDDFVSAG